MAILRGLVQEITPPILVHGIRKILHAKSGHNSSDECTVEKDPEWYDKAFEANNHWCKHYTESPYYFLWTVIVDRIVRENVDSILDIGCGSGQLASLLRDKGIKAYQGFDFSSKRIEQAKKVCPEFLFTVDDAFQTNLFSTYDYNAVVCTEFLEHVERDIEIITRIKSGTKFYGTVPNFPYVSHVRHFIERNQVYSRYKKYFKEFEVDIFLANAKGKTFYLLEGTKL